MAVYNVSSEEMAFASKGMEREIVRGGGGGGLLVSYCPNSVAFCYLLYLATTHTPTGSVKSVNSKHALSTPQTICTCTVVLTCIILLYVCTYT